MGAEACSYDNIFPVIDDLLAVVDRFAIGTAPRVLREVKAALSPG